MNLKKQAIATIEQKGDDTLYDGVVIKKFKARRTKEKTHARRTNPICTNCLSSLVVSGEGKYECSGDRLKIWEKEFLAYTKMSDKEKIRYLMAFSHPDLFEELFEKWSYKEGDGHRPNFECGYSNKIYSLINPLRVMMPDPILVKKIEKSLGRKLTEEELYGEKDIFREGKTYFEDYKKGRIRAKITLIYFPDGC